MSKENSGGAKTGGRPGAGKGQGPGNGSGWPSTHPRNKSGDGRSYNPPATAPTPPKA